MVPSMGRSDSAVARSSPAHFVRAAAGELGEMRGARLGGDRAAIELVPVRMLEDVLADLRLDLRVRIQLRDDARRVPFEQHTTGIEDDVSDHDRRLNGDSSPYCASNWGLSPFALQAFIGMGTG